MDTVTLVLQKRSFDPLSGEIRDGFVHGAAQWTRREDGLICYAGRILKELALTKT